MNRGEIWTATGLGYGSKPRPAIIVQNDLDETDASVTVVPLTSVESETGRIRVSLLIPDRNGLRQSFAMADKVMTVKRSNVRKRIDVISHIHMHAIDRALIAHLGIEQAA